MPRVRFVENFDYRPKPGVTIAYKAGMELLVTTRCAQKAVAAEKARRVNKKAKADERR